MQKQKPGAQKPSKWKTNEQEQKWKKSLWDASITFLGWNRQNGGKFSIYQINMPVQINFPPESFCSCNKIMPQRKLFLKKEKNVSYQISTVSGAGKWKFVGNNLIKLALIFGTQEYFQKSK